MLLTPVRIVWNKLLSKLLVKYMTEGKEDPSFFEANREQWIEVIAPALVKMFNVDMDKLTPAECRKIFNGWTGWVGLRAKVKQLVPAWLPKSLVCRLLSCVINTPTASWFLADMTWIELLPLSNSAANPTVTCVFPSRHSNSPAPLTADSADTEGDGNPLANLEEVIP